MGTAPLDVMDVLKHAAVGLAILELSGDFRFVNERFASLHGVRVDDMIGRNFRDSKIDRIPFYEAVHEEFVLGRRDVFKDDVIFQNIDGADRWFAVESTLVRSSCGQPDSIVVIQQDITERKLAEQRAQQMADRLEAIHSSEAIGMNYFRLDGTIGEPNEALLAMAGISPERADHLALSDLTPDEWRDQDTVMFRRLHETRRPVSFLKEIVSQKTGHAIPVSVTATLFTNDPEYDGVSLVCDLGDLFSAREEAEEYRHKADLALGASSIGLWDLNPTSGQINFDERSRLIFGVEPMTEVSFGTLVPLVPEEDLRRIQKALNQLVTSDCLISLTVEFKISSTKGERVVCATGRTFRVRQSGELRVVGTLLDITDTKHFEQRILESEERFRTLAETIPQIVFTADEYGHVNYVNRRWYDFTGQRPLEKVTRDQIREAIHSADLPMVREKWHQALTEGRACEIEYRMLTASGNFRWVIVRASPLLDRNGKTTRWFGSCTDIDGHRRLNDELWIERDRAEKANQMKSSFLANMSHEIRTPLGAILGFTELLADGSLSQAERNEYLGIVSRNSRSLSRIVDDVLDLSKVEAGLLTFERVAFSPEILLRDIVMLFSEKARRKGLMIDLKIAADIPPSLISDPMRIRQVVNNLLSNSLKFTEDGGVSIRAERSAQQISITVEDTGAGISREHAANLFQPFVQGDELLAKKHGGTGLGLHLSKKLAEALGGSLKFVERPVEIQGSCFVISIPLIEAPSDATPEAVDDPRNGQATGLRPAFRDLDGLRILVVDDAADNRKLIERLLAKTGAKTDFAIDGRSAVRSAAEHPFDLILMDLQMPDIDGFEATLEIRDQHITTPIVALTAHAVDEMRERCERAGFSGFLTKPIDSGSLMKIVRELTVRKFEEPQSNLMPLA